MSEFPWIGPREVVYRNPYQEVYRVTVAFADGRNKEYFVTDYGARVGLLVVRGDSVLLVRQYRLLLNALSWEIPGGKVDDGETSEAAAVRECLEETGLLCSNLKPLIRFDPGLDTLQNPTQIFLSKDFVESPGRFITGEVDHWEWVSLNRCLKMIEVQRITDGLSVVALLAYRCLIAEL